MEEIILALSFECQGLTTREMRREEGKGRGEKVKVEVQEADLGVGKRARELYPPRVRDWPEPLLTEKESRIIVSTQ